MIWRNRTSQSVCLQDGWSLNKIAHVDYSSCDIFLNPCSTSSIKILTFFVAFSFTYSGWEKRNLFSNSLTYFLKDLFQRECYIRLGQHIKSVFRYFFAKFLLPIRLYLHSTIVKYKKNTLNSSHSFEYSNKMVEKLIRYMCFTQFAFKKNLTPF